MSLDPFRENSYASRLAIFRGSASDLSLRNTLSNVGWYVLRFFQVYLPVRRVLLVFSEACIIATVFVVAGALARGTSPLVHSREMALSTMAFVSAVVVLLSHCLDLYSPGAVAFKSRSYVGLLLSVGACAGLAFAITRVAPSAAPKGLSPLSVLLVAPFLALWRAFYMRVLELGYFRKPVLVLGSGTRALRVRAKIRSRRDLGLEFVGHEDSFTAETNTRENWVKMLSESCTHDGVKGIIVALDDPRGCMPADALLDLWMTGIPVQDANAWLERIDGKIDVSTLTPSALMFSEGFRLSRLATMSRRLLALGSSLLIAIAVAPLVPFIVLAVRLSSPGPILLRQKRVGIKRRVFTLYKFRSMRMDAEATGPQWSIPGDPRVTRVGRFLRLTRLDEIPQLWNILKGEMNLVGPRPERPEFIEHLSNSVPYYDLRHMVRPGITGWAQVRYRYAASADEAQEKLEYDLYYIKHMSLSLDVVIMLETIKTILRQRGAV